MIGKTIKSSSGVVYKITKPIAADDRPNANVYLCEDQNGTEFIAKHFYNGTPVSFIGLSVYNHYGRRRDGSNLVFNEIKKKTKDHDFLIKHIDRIKYDGSWIIILEYVEGDPLYHFITKNYLKQPDTVKLAIAELANTLRKWHTNGFAHGDPHLDNAMVHFHEGKIAIRLIDYGIIHHADFECCKRIGCFNPEWYNRIEEDLENDSDKLGRGFLEGLKSLENQLKLNTLFSDHFISHYQIIIN